MLLQGCKIKNRPYYKRLALMTPSQLQLFLSSPCARSTSVMIWMTGGTATTSQGPGPIANNDVKLVVRQRNTDCSHSRRQVTQQQRQAQHSRKGSSRHNLLRIATYLECNNDRVTTKPRLDTRTAHPRSGGV